MFRKCGSGWLIYIQINRMFKPHSVIRSQQDIGYLQTYCLGWVSVGLNQALYVNDWRSDDRPYHDVNVNQHMFGCPMMGSSSVWSSVCKWQWMPPILTTSSGNLASAVSWLDTLRSQLCGHVTASLLYNVKNFLSETQEALGGETETRWFSAALWVPVVLSFIATTSRILGNDDASTTKNATKKSPIVGNVRESSEKAMSETPRIDCSSREYGGPLQRLTGTRNTQG